MLLVMLLADHLRLANGGSPCAGRVEVYHDGQWGTVNGYGFGDRGWDMLDAAVVCKELGCGVALSASGDAHFGEGSGPVVTEDVQCRASESTLRGCQSYPWSHYSWVSHSYDAGVICSGTKSPRLVNGSSRCSGRVELYTQDTWGSVCGNDLNMEMAGYICKYLGCGFALSVSSDARFGEGSGPVVGWPDCGQDRDGGIFCSEYHSLKLIGGNNNCSGTVKLQRDYKSGTICDYYWDMKDADVLCRQLDCGFALSTGLGAQFGKETGRIWKTNFNCVGTQWHLRLESGVSRCDGRVEIYHNGTWGRLLDDSWNISDGDVICRQLNCGSAISVYNSSQYGEGTGPVWINNVQCVGTETHIWNCPYSTVASSSGSSSDVGVLCSDNKQLRINQSNGSTVDAGVQSSTEDVQIRLMDGGSSCAGRVEIYYNGTWGTVCDDSWGSLEADVVCKQLGCGPVFDEAADALCGRTSGPVWLDEMRCSGNESALWECASSPWGQHDCGHKEDVSIVCTAHKSLRLVNGQHSCEGRVEVFYNGTWGTVCSDSMGLEDAEVICKQLGCGHALKVDIDGQIDKASGPIWMDEVECNSQESFLWQCSSTPWGEHDCEHSDDVRVVCEEKFTRKTARAKQCPGRSPDEQHHLSGQKMRLVGGSSICSGRVEILSNKTWGTVCDDSWDIREASVVCGQLDCGPAVRAVGQAGFGQGAGQIWLDELHCRGSESFLWDCVSASAGRSDCVHKEDAGVVCSVQLINIPFVVCIVLGILLAVVLFALIVQMDSNSSGTEEKYPSARLYQAIYEEIEDRPIRRRNFEADSTVPANI
ncbi:deleted in malignant brain tumors 1 protein-like [Callorhinchus milii]|uniref:deleted in malignant brain tumors 1 protein-like n=1 Tax=Callorhinchus milii TaxID=7868 RepID=UPI001C3F7A8E|nr:deleted in malignant brain tumors 1 protein-like [Callorhinchus milii]